MEDVWVGNIPCMFKGCTGTTSFQTRDEEDHEVAFCDPAWRDDTHYLQFQRAVDDGTVASWLAENADRA